MNIGWVARCSIALMPLVICGLTSGPITNATDRFSSPPSQHIGACLHFLEEMGHEREAEQLGYLLGRGQLLVKKMEPNDFGMTVYGVITLNKDRMWGAQIPAKGTLARYSSVYTIASTMLHELKHVDQGQEYVNKTGTGTTKLWEGGDLAELEAYGLQWSAQSSWLLDFQERMLASSDPERKRVLRQLICEETSTFKAAVREALGQYGGRNEWDLLRFENPKPLPDTRWPAGDYIDSAEDLERLIGNIRNDAGCDRAQPKVDCSTPRALDNRWAEAVKKAIPGFPHFDESNRKDQMNTSQAWRSWDYSVTTDKGIVSVSWSASGEKPHIILYVDWRLGAYYQGHRSAQEMEEQYRRSRDNAKVCGEASWDRREGTFGAYSCLGSRGYRGTIDLSMASDPYGAQAGAYQTLPCADVRTSVSIQVFAPPSHGPRNKPEVIEAMDQTARTYAKEIEAALIRIAGGSVPTMEQRIAAERSGVRQPAPQHDDAARSSRPAEPQPKPKFDEVPARPEDPVTSAAGDVTAVVDDPALEQAESLLNQDRLPEAERALQEAIRKRPNVPEYHVRLGDVRFLQDQLGAAEAAYREAIRLEPRNAEHHALLGEVQMAQSNLAEAEKCYRRASELAPDDPGYHEILSMIYSEIGRFDEAERAARRAAELNR